VRKWLIGRLLPALGVLLVLLALYEYFTLPTSGEIRGLATVNPRSTALMTQREQEAHEKHKAYRPERQWVPLSQINEHLVHAVIVGEDGTFYEHEGVDWYEIKESIKKDIEKGKLARGGSTITQQLAKNLYLTTSKDPVRKLRELVITTRLEDELTKSRILELYLNSIEWGEGLFGAEAASLRYFGKNASALSREEAARLAAVVPSPLKHSPARDDRFVSYRTAVILGRMEGRGW
jgi:monofunctional biosynthetic peptidoglycan transglycosylase